MKTNKQVMHNAHILFSQLGEMARLNGTVPCWSSALSEAWHIQRIRRAMQAGAVEITYIKSNLNLVKRRGTLCPDLIPMSHAPKGQRSRDIEQGIEQPVWNVVTYYDLDMHGWRSFRITDLVGAQTCSVDTYTEFNNIEPIV